MPRRLWVALAVLVLGGFAFNSSAVAQSSDHVEIFGGYSYLSKDFSLASPNGVSGWDASATFKMQRYFGVVADFSGFRPSYTFGVCPACVSSRSTAYTFLFGPQISIPLHRITPFGRFLLGDAHLSPSDSGVVFNSNTSFTVAAGGGFDFSLTRHFALRGQADWLRVGFTSRDDQIHNPHNVARAATGLVFRF